MESDKTFEAIAHPLRIRILKLLAERPMSFSELKRRLGIKSSGKLDFHLKKLDNLIVLDEDGKYTLTREGYAALQAIITIKRYGWQKRAFILNTAVYIAVMIYTECVIVWRGFSPLYVAVMVLTSLWYVYYFYVSIVKRKVFKVC